LIYKQGNDLTTLEIKSEQTIHQEFFKGLDYFKKLLPEKVKSSYLVYTGERESVFNQHQIINYQNCDKIMRPDP